MKACLYTYTYEAIMRYILNYREIINLEYIKATTPWPNGKLL